MNSTTYEDPRLDACDALDLLGAADLRVLAYQALWRMTDEAVDWITAEARDRAAAGGTR